MLIPGLRWFFVVAAALAFVAGILLFVLAMETDRFFSWTIGPRSPRRSSAPPTGRRACCLPGRLASTWERARAVLPPVFIIAVLLLGATLIRLDKFDMESLFGWFWLIVYIVVPPLLVYLIVEQVREAGPVPRGAVRCRCGLGLSRRPGSRDGGHRRGAVRLPGIR